MTFVWHEVLILPFATTFFANVKFFREWGGVIGNINKSELHSLFKFSLILMHKLIRSSSVDFYSYGDFQRESIRWICIASDLQTGMGEGEVSSRSTSSLFTWTTVGSGNFSKSGDPILSCWRGWGQGGGGVIKGLKSHFSQSKRFLLVSWENATHAIFWVWGWAVHPALLRWKLSDNG